MFRNNGTTVLVVLAVLSGGGYGALALAGDLTGRPGPYLAGLLTLFLLLAAAAALFRGGSRPALWVVLVSALLFRLVAAAGGPAMSDDVYRYVWDGRVQAAGHHPYRYTPEAEELAGLRDPDWEKINHRELGTIYPPLSQYLFHGLAAAGAGARGFRIAFALLDFGVVLALWRLLVRTGRPVGRLVLYAWNPLAVMEGSGSGHLEPLGVLLMVLSVAWLAIPRRSAALSAAALAGSIHAKLFAAVLLPGHLRRMKLPAVLVLAAVLLALALPLALGGPVAGEGLGHYAERWERNGLVHAVILEGAELLDTGNRLKPLVEALSIRGLYRWVWPRELSRVLVAALAAGWILWLTFRRRLDPVEEALWALGGTLLLLPTVHPWYVLWVLPLAAACRSTGWLVLGATVSLAYLGGSGEVHPGIRLVEYGLPLAWIVPEGFRRLRRPSGDAPFC